MEFRSYLRGSPLGTVCPDHFVESSVAKKCDCFPLQTKTATITTAAIY